MEIDKNIKPSIFHAIQALVGGDLSTSNRESFEATKYHSEQTPPSKKDAEAKLEEITILWNRANSYPDLENQLDMLFHAIDAGKVDKTSDFYKSLKAVKDKYPKG